jgi:hypothetical protein
MIYILCVSAGLAALSKSHNVVIWKITARRIRMGFLEAALVNETIARTSAGRVKFDYSIGSSQTGLFTIGQSPMWLYRCKIFFTGFVSECRLSEVFTSSVGQRLRVTIG